MSLEKTVIERESLYHADVYQRYPIVLSKGLGALVWDINGKEYIDCMGGYGVAVVGHCNPNVVEAVNRQMCKLITCHGSTYNDARADFLERIVRIAPKGLDRCFLNSSGAEAVECAIKVARKHTGRKNLVAMTGSFHGKTMGALSATWNAKYRSGFEPLVPGFSHVPMGDSEKIRKNVDKDAAAVIIEPIQGESGIHLPPNGYLQEVREVCDKNGALLIFDEIQSGLGRTGRMWAGQHWNVIPDIICIGKGVAGGLPMGVTISRSDVMSSLKKGEHTSTFGGNPVSCAAGSAAVDYLVAERLPERAERLGNLFFNGLQALGKKHKVVREVRGKGLMLGIELRFEVKDILMEALQKNTLLLYSGRNVIRLLPPLVIEEDQIRKVLAVIDESLTNEEKRRSIVV